MYILLPIISLFVVYLVYPVLFAALYKMQINEKVFYYIYTIETIYVAYVIYAGSGGNIKSTLFDTLISSAIFFFPTKELFKKITSKKNTVDIENKAAYKACSLLIMICLAFEIIGNWLK